jgi:DNA-binding IclR family transcriptional regulator
MAREVVIRERRYWIVSEPIATGWRATVLEVLDGEGRVTNALGIVATAETRGAADEAAVGQLQRHVRTHK